MANIGNPVRRVTVVPIKHPVPATNEPQPKPLPKPIPAPQREDEPVE